MLSGQTAVEISDSSVVGYHCLTALELESGQITDHQCFWTALMVMSLGLALTPPVQTAVFWTTIPNQANLGWVCPSCHIGDKMRVKLWREEKIRSIILTARSKQDLLKESFFLYVNSELIWNLPNPNQFTDLDGVLFAFVLIFLRCLAMFEFTAKCTQSAQYQQCQVILQASLQDVSTAVAQWASPHHITGQMGQSSGLQAFLSLK